MSDITQTILQEFRKREEIIKREGEERDRAAAVVLKESEKKLKEIRIKLDAARVNYASMVTDYMTTEATIAAAAAARLKESALTVEGMKAGRGTMREYLERGLSDDALQKKAAGEAADKLKSGLAVIRELSRSIIVLEKAEADELRKIYYAQASPAQNQILKLRAEIETLNHGVSVVLESSPLAAYQSDEKRDALTRADGRFIAGKSWLDLDLDGLRRLRFDCEIADQFLPDLEKIIQEVKPGERVNVNLLSGQYTQGPARLDYSRVRAEGVPITSTSIGMRK